MSLEGFSALEKKRRDIFLKDNVAHQVMFDSPLQIVMAILRTSFEFELVGSGKAARF
jgi:hypothetical protein